MMMMMMVMILMVDVVVLVISASDNRWGSLVGLGRARRDRGLNLLSCEKSMSQSIAWSVVGFVVLAVRWFYYVWLGRWEREIFRAMTRRAACWGYSVIVVSDRAGRSH